MLQVTLDISSIPVLIDLIDNNLLATDNKKEVINLLQKIQDSKKYRELFKYLDNISELTTEQLQTFIYDNQLYDDDLNQLYDRLTSNEILHVWEEEIEPSPRDDDKFYNLRNKAIRLAKENDWKNLVSTLESLSALLAKYDLI